MYKKLSDRREDYTEKLFNGIKDVINIYVEDKNIRETMMMIIKDNAKGWLNFICEEAYEQGQQNCKK